MVLLKCCLALPLEEIFSTFTFHYGIIKITTPDLTTTTTITFTFHYGIIKIEQQAQTFEDVQIFTFHYGIIKMI